MKFEDAVIKILKELDKAPDTFVSEENIKKLKIEKNNFSQILGYINNETLANQRNEGKGREYMINPKAKKFLIEKESAQRQENFNRIVAFTASILALIGIYTFIKDLGFINETNDWIKYVFLAIVFAAIFPIAKFIINSYAGNK